ncbi:hypothetical protein MXL54_00215 [Enterobacteriaceae bacterium G50]|nr:hypothetical protein [Enterobacteriaceae bacterium G50]
MSELTAAHSTLEKSREVTNCPDGVDLQDHLKKLVAENAAIKVMNDCLAEELRGYESDGAFDGPSMHMLWWKCETPATDSILRAAEARGVEKAREIVRTCHDNICPGGLAENRQYEEAIVQPYLDGISDELDFEIEQLREGKA